MRQLMSILLVAAVAAVATAESAASPERPVLEARAVLPANTFAPGPPSGQFIGPGPINGVSVPFASQPVQGFSAVLPAEPGSYWVVPDNGYGAKANSSDFLLRVFHVTPHFRTAKGGDGSVAVDSFIQLRDPDGRVPFALTRGRPAADGIGLRHRVHSPRERRDALVRRRVRPLPPAYGRDGEG